MARAPTTGMATFGVVWAGQFVSVIGSALTGFALSIWIYLETGSTTALAVIMLATAVPGIVVSPVAGAFVDRWDRRRAMMLADAGAAAGTLLIVFLLVTDRLEVWNLALAVGVSATFGTFQWPAYSASVTLLVPKRHHGRAAGMVQLAEAIAHVVAPALAALVLVRFSIEAVIAIDLITFGFAIATLTFVRFPRPPASAAGREGAGSFLGEALQALRYLQLRRGLLALMLYFSLLNLFFGFVSVLIFPLVLGFASEQAVGNAISIGGLGMVAGSILQSAWGGPTRRMNGILWFTLLLSAGLVVGSLRPSITLIAVAVTLVFFSLPLGQGSSQALWQAKVEPDLQGRVFALRRAAASAATPIAYLAAGPVVDRIFEPMMQPGGALAGTLGAVIGTGPGRGAAAVFFIIGFLTILLTVGAWLYRPLRNVEDLIPDAIGDEALPIPEAESGPSSTGLSPEPTSG